MLKKPIIACQEAILRYLSFFSRLREGYQRIFKEMIYYACGKLSYRPNPE